MSSNSFELHGIETRYRFRRHIPRALLNSLGPLVVLAAYALIVGYYLSKSSPSGIIPSPAPINPGIVFYAWFVLSVFVLGWPKSGLAGFEAAALGRPALAPTNAARLMWHTETTWSEVNGWYRALVAAYHHGVGKLSGSWQVEWDGPSLIWF